MNTFEPQELAQIVAASRARDGILYVRLYCEAPDCAAREIDVKLKDYDDTLVETLSARIVRCPVCSSDRVSLHHIRTSDEQRAAEDEEAIARVNTLRYIRDRHAAGEDVVVLPAGILWNTELPP